MAGVGAWQAFNLDGGGSSTMWLASSGYLHPTGTVRAVANHWGVFAGSTSGSPEAPGSCFTPGGCVPRYLPEANGADFRDFPAQWVGQPEASALSRAGVADGCGTQPDPMFCPRCPFRRREMARWLVRAAGLDASTLPTTATFTDVPRSDPDFAAVEAIAEANITSGCGSGRFCPDNAVTRGQAAAFLTRAAGWPTIRPEAASFADVPTSHVFFAPVETIHARCVTNGCGSGNFCPDDPITRAQAAAFVARTWDIADANPCFDAADGGAGATDGGAGSPDAGADNPDAGADAGAAPGDGGAPEAGPGGHAGVDDGGSERTDGGATAPRPATGCGCVGVGGSPAGGWLFLILLYARGLSSWRRRRAPEDFSRPRSLRRTPRGFPPSPP